MNMINGTQKNPGEGGLEPISSIVLNFLPPSGFPSTLIFLDLRELCCSDRRGLICPERTGLVCSDLKGLIWSDLKGLICSDLKGLICSDISGLTCSSKGLICSHLTFSGGDVDRVTYGSSMRAGGLYIDMGMGIVGADACEYADSLMKLFD
jgi:hypothetical protein